LKYKNKQGHNEYKIFERRRRKEEDEEKKRNVKGDQNHANSKQFPFES